MRHLFVSPEQNFVKNLSFCLRDFHSFFNVISQTCVFNSGSSIANQRCQSSEKRLIEEWRRFDQNTIDRAVNQWHDRLRKYIPAK